MKLHKYEVGKKHENYLRTLIQTLYLHKYDLLFLGSYPLNIFHAELPKRFQSLTLKVETTSLKTSAIGKNPDCAAGTAKPAPTVLALSLKGLQPYNNTRDKRKRNGPKDEYGIFCPRKRSMIE